MFLLICSREAINEIAESIDRGNDQERQRMTQWAFLKDRDKKTGEIVQQVWLCVLDAAYLGSIPSTPDPHQE